MICNVRDYISSINDKVEEIHVLLSDIVYCMYQIDVLSNLSKTDGERYVDFLNKEEEE